MKKKINVRLEKEQFTNNFKYIYSPTKTLKKYDCYGIVDVLTNKCVGQLILKIKKKSVEIMALEIYDRRKGYGTATILKIVNLNKKKIIVKTNTSSFSFYAMFGFKPKKFIKKKSLMLMEVLRK